MKRRDFLQKGAAASAAFTIIPSQAMGFSGTPPNNRIRLGFIGAGRQGRGLMTNFVRYDDCEVVAVSDVDRLKMDFFEETLLKKIAADSGKTTTLDKVASYRGLLNRADIDAVVIAAPDHWHAQMAVDAAKAKKDIYCEKPLSSSVAEGRAMVAATRKYQAVFQTGSMQRSSFNFRQAVDLIRNGYIGAIKEAYVAIGDPSVPCTLPEMEAPENIDWDAWIGPAPYRGYHMDLACPLEDKRWAKWRDYEPYGGGMITDWGAHHFDIVQWALDQDANGPVRFTPPTDPRAKRGLQFSYANGITVTHRDWIRNDNGRTVRNGIQFLGTQGVIEVSRGFLRTYPDTRLAKKTLSDADTHRVYHSKNHHLDWLNAIRERSKPICDVEVGHRTASVCNIANICYDLQRPLAWNPETETFSSDPGADLLLDRAYRGTWDYRNF